MIIYKLEIDKRNGKSFVLSGSQAERLARVRSGEYAFRCFGRKKGENWKPPEIEWFDGHKKKIARLKDPDIAGAFSHANLIMSPHAAELLKPAVKNTCELLPIPFQGEVWIHLNVLNFIGGAVDKEKSEYETSRAGERAWIRKPKFYPKRLPHAQLFMVVESQGYIYYSEHYADDNPNTFKNILENNNLFGITLKKVDEYKTVSGT